MTRRPPSRLTVKPPAPSYPQFTGMEPCAGIGVVMYYMDDYWSTDVDTMRDACHACPLFDACREWSLHRERWGFWAGMTMTERKLARRQLGIRLQEPQYEILPMVERGDDESAA